MHAPQGAAAAARVSGAGVLRSALALPQRQPARAAVRQARGNASVPPPDKSIYNSVINKNRIPWYAHTNERLRRGVTDANRVATLKHRNRGKEVLPIFPSSYHRSRDDPHEQSDVGRLPFLRNGIPSYFEIEDIMGEPEIFTANEIVKHYSQGVGSSNVRPYDMQYRQSGPGVGASQFMGTFLNAFVALDVPEWDIKALMADIERPHPYLLLRNLTELLGSQFMRPRRLPDEDLAGILEHARDPLEASNILQYSLEHHTPGMQALEAFYRRAESKASHHGGLLRGISTSQPGGAELPEGTTATRHAFETLLGRGVAPTLQGINAVLKSCNSSPLLPEAEAKAQSEAGLLLFKEVQAGRFPGIAPDLETFNATLRAVSEHISPSEVFEVYALMGGTPQASLPEGGEAHDEGGALPGQPQVLPSTFTLNALLRACRSGSGFSDAAAVFDALCVRGVPVWGQPPQQVAEASAGAVAEAAKVHRVAASLQTWSILLDTAAGKEGEAEEGEEAGLRRAQQLEFVLQRMSEVPTRMGRKGGLQKTVWLRPTPWLFERLPALLGGVHARFGTEAPEESPQGVAEFVAACLGVLQEHPVPHPAAGVCRQVCDAVWLAAVEKNLATTPAVFKNFLLVFAALGDRDKVDAVYHHLCATPFAQAAHHEIYAQVQAEADAEESSNAHAEV